MDKFNETLTLSAQLYQRSIEQSQITAKEHYLSSAKTCDGRSSTDFGLWLIDIDRLATMSGTTCEQVALFTSRVPYTAT